MTPGVRPTLGLECLWPASHSRVDSASQEKVVFGCRGHRSPRLLTEIGGSGEKIRQERREGLGAAGRCPPSRAGAQPRGPGRETRHEPGPRRPHRGRTIAKPRDVEPACDCTRHGVRDRRPVTTGADSESRRGWATPCDRGPDSGAGDPGRSARGRCPRVWGGRASFRCRRRCSIAAVAPGRVRRAGPSSGIRWRNARDEWEEKEESEGKDAREEASHPRGE
jgi:hypothetical protein